MDPSKLPIISKAPDVIEPGQTLHIGVTGHRDIRESDRVKESLVATLEAIYETLQPRRVVLHTPLAMGADQLMLDAIRESDFRNARVQAVLPEDQEAYGLREDFDTEKGRLSLKSLLERCDGQPVELWNMSFPEEGGRRPERKQNYFGRLAKYLRNTCHIVSEIWDALRGLKLEKARMRLEELLSCCEQRTVNPRNESDSKQDEPDKGRDRDGFARLATYMRNECHIVFALWDGLINGKPGGTGDVVENLVSSSVATGLFREVYWLSCARESNPFPAVQVLSWKVLERVPGETMAEKGSSRRKKWRMGGNIALGISFVGFLGLGYRGYVQLDDDAGFSAFFASLAHITLGFEFDGSADPPPWWLVFSRFLAAICVLLTAGKVLDKFFHLSNWVDLACTKRRKHDLVFGIGRRGLDLLRDCHRNKWPVIAVDPRPGEGVEEDCNDMGIPITQHSFEAGKEPSYLNLAEAQNVFICTGSDLSNMKIANRLAVQHAKAGGPGLLRCSVGLVDPSNFNVLANALPDDHQLDLRLLNKECITSRALLREACLDRFSSMDEKGAQAVVVGEGMLADELLKQIIQIGHFEQFEPTDQKVESWKGREILVARLCENAEEACRRFCQLYPCYTMDRGHPGTGEFRAKPSEVWLRERVLPELRFLELPPSSRGRQFLMGDKFDYDKWSTTVFVCDPDPVQSTRIAEDIARPLEMERSNSESGGAHRSDITLWFYTPGLRRSLQRELERNLDCSFPCLPVRSFGDFLGPCNRDCALGEHGDSIARRLNGAYHEVDDLSDLPVLSEKWRGSSEHDKDSSRQAAEHALVKHRIRSRCFDLNGGELSEMLAQVEHRRWCCELLLKGFLPLTRIPSESPDFDGPSDEEAEIVNRWFYTDKAFKGNMKASGHHVDLLPWEDLELILGTKLAEQEKKKDNDQVAFLDRILLEKILQIRSEKMKPNANISRPQNLIIFSAGESLENGTLDKVKSYFRDLKHNCVEWRELFSSAKDPDAIALLPMLLKKVPTFDFAVILGEGVDEVARGNSGKDQSGMERIMRDNVLFETGLCTMALGTNRVILLVEDDIRIPEDLQGLQNQGFGNIGVHCMKFDKGAEHSLSASLLRTSDLINEHSKDVSPIVVGAAISTAEGFFDNFVLRFWESIGSGYQETKRGEAAEGRVLKHDPGKVKMKILIPDRIDDKVKNRIFDYYQDQGYRDGIIKDAGPRAIGFKYRIDQDGVMVVCDVPTTISASYATVIDILSLSADDDHDQDSHHRFLMKELDTFLKTMKRLMRSEVIEQKSARFGWKQEKKDYLISCLRRTRLEVVSFD